MAKLTLQDIALISGSETTINNNSAAIETAMENTLSRDGTSPNAMNAVLDMDSNRIINVPDPVSGSDAVNKTWVESYVSTHGGGGGGGVTDHGMLTGLADNDHPQYAVAGSDKQVQVNNAGAFGASSALTFDTVNPDNGVVLRVYDSSAVSSNVFVSSDGGRAWLVAESAYDGTQGTVGGVVNYAGGNIWLQYNRGTLDSPQDVVAGDGLGLIQFAGVCQSGTRYEAPAQISCEVKDVGSYIGANIVFATKPNNTSNPLYRMRIDADGGLVLRSSYNTDPTGGSKGPGTINCAGIYVNGTAVSGGSPAGSDTQVQFNDGGAFGGDAGFTYNKTNKAVTLGGATVTANAPVLDLTQTWNNAAVEFHALKVNVTQTAKLTGSLFALFQDGGVDKFGIASTGTGLYLPNGVLSFGTGKDPTSNRFFSINTSSGLAIRSGAYVGWASNNSDTSGAPDVSIYRDAANVLALRASTAAMSFRVYNTYTDASNYERGKIAWASNVLTIGTEKLGTGTARGIDFQTDSTTRLSIGASGSFTVADAQNFALGTTTGTKIGTGTTQKIGFYNATPVVQPSGTGETTGFTTGAGTAVKDDSTFTGNVGSTAYRISDIVKALKNLGLLAA